LIGVAVAGPGYDVEAFARDSARVRRTNRQAAGGGRVAARGRRSSFAAQGVAGVLDRGAGAFAPLGRLSGRMTSGFAFRDANLPIWTGAASELHSRSVAEDGVPSIGTPLR
jgi:hypothetical protein